MGVAVRSSSRTHSTEAQQSAPRRAVLAIDYGRRRMGLAVSDELRVTARPLAVLERTNRRADLARIREICRKNAVGAIVVGWPLRLDGGSTEMARESEGFAKRLRAELGLPVELADERLSSWEAHRTLGEASGKTARAGAARGGGKAPRARREEVDDVAAAVILRDYLNRRADERVDKARADAQD